MLLVVCVTGTFSGLVGEITTVVDMITELCFRNAFSVFTFKVGKRTFC